MINNMYNSTPHHTTPHHTTPHHTTLLSSVRKLAGKIFCVENGRYQFSIRVLNRNVFVYRHCIIMKFSTSGHENANSPSINVVMKRITSENIDTLKAIDPNIDLKKPFLEQKHGRCEAFGLWSDSDEPLAYVWLVYKGGHYAWWSFMNIDAWITGVFVGERYRRKGCCEYMINRVLNYLKSEKNIDEAYLSVRIRNYPARNAYKKLGGIEISHKKIFKICRIQIPFHGYTL